MIVSSPPPLIIRPNFGTCATESEALDLLVSRLSAALDPRMIWLFGSRARGNARPDSDFDLLVVGEKTSVFDPEDYDLAYAPLLGIGIGVDVVPCGLDVYNASLGLNTSFVRRIVDEGRLVYGHLSA